MDMYPSYLVAVDNERNRVFVLEKPHLIALKKDGNWNYGATISEEEIQRNFELIMDPDRAKSWIEEAKAALNII